MFLLPHTEAMHIATAGNGTTLPNLLGVPRERVRIGLLLLLLTLSAAWIDMLYSSHNAARGRQSELLLTRMGTPWNGYIQALTW